MIALLVPEGNQPDRPIAAVSDNYRTEVAEHREIALPDGSTLHLGALSRVTVTFADLERSITLHEGEALFEVSSDPNRPFVVTAGPNVVRAVGTAFNVKIGLEDITVTVVEGEVSITGPVDETAVEPVAVLEGQSVGYAKTGAVGAVEETDVTLATTWRDGRLTFIGADLESVVADVNRYARQEIVIADRAVRELRFTGTVFHSDIADWLAGLERAFPIRVVDLGERGTLILSESDG